MISNNNREKQEQLMSILGELVKPIPQKLIPVFVFKLTNLYGERDSFRHSYSEFYPWIVAHASDNPDQMDALLGNLDAINSELETMAASRPSVFNNASRCVFKLYDHLTMEVTRFNQQQNSVRDQVDIHSKIVGFSASLENLQNKMDKEESKLSSYKLDVVAVISLFSGVIIAFFGGLNYISAAISSVALSNVWKLALICVIAGFVIFNTLVSMLYLVSRIMGRSIWTFCRKAKISGSCEQCEKNCGAFRLVARRMPLVFWINFVLIAVGFFSVIQIIFF